MSEESFYQDKWPVKEDLFDEIHGNPVPNILSRHKMLTNALDGWNRSGWSFEHMAHDIGVYLGRLLTKRESDHLATIAELTRERDELRKMVAKGFMNANNSLYFDDSSDYQSALNQVCHELSGGGEWRDGEIYGETFIPEPQEAPL